MLGPLTYWKKVKTDDGFNYELEDVSNRWIRQMHAGKLFWIIALIITNIKKGNQLSLTRFLARQVVVSFVASGLFKMRIGWISQDLRNGGRMRTNITSSMGLRFVRIKQRITKRRLKCWLRRILQQIGWSSVSRKAGTTSWSGINGSRHLRKPSPKEIA